MQPEPPKRHKGWHQEFESRLRSDSDPTEPKSPTKEFYSDRFIPSRNAGLQDSFDLLSEPLKTPPRSGVQARDSAREEADHQFDQLLKSELYGEEALRASSQGENLSPSNLHCDPPSSSPQRGNLFHFKSPKKIPQAGIDSPSREAYSTSPLKMETQNALNSPRKEPREIPKIPFKVLDAPKLRDDFYLNLLDWSSQNIIAVGLGRSVYLWSGTTCAVHKLCDLGPFDSVTSVSWTEKGSHLAVGTDRGAIQLWDVAASKRLRNFDQHDGRVGSLAWNRHLLASGSRDRMIHLHDARLKDDVTWRLSAHRQEVCGLKWSPNGQQLASGGNDNALIIWDRATRNPLYRFGDHCAAVKAIAWSPHQSGLLVSGGGTADRRICFRNTNTGTTESSIDTGSQVCSLAWSTIANEIVSTHGYSQNQVMVWKSNGMRPIATLTGHTYRVLYLALSPDGRTVVTGAGDETLRFWNIFSKPASSSSPSQPRSILDPFSQVR